MLALAFWIDKSNFDQKAQLRGSVRGREREIYKGVGGEEGEKAEEKRN